MTILSAWFGNYQYTSQYTKQHGLSITNTLVKMRNMYKTTWMHPRSKNWHLIDYVIVQQRDRRDVMVTCAMRGADGWTEHRLLRSVLKLRIRKPVRKSTPVSKLNVKVLQDPRIRLEFQHCLDEQLRGEVDMTNLTSGELLTERMKSALAVEGRKHCKHIQKEGRPICLWQ